MLQYKIKKATKQQIQEHLKICSPNFVPALDTILDIDAYAEKIFNNATTFEAWNQNVLVGLIAVYLNNTETKEGFITNVSITPDMGGKGVAKALLDQTFVFAIQYGFRTIKLEVHPENTKATELYLRKGFFKIKEIDNKLILQYNLESK